MNTKRMMALMALFLAAVSPVAFTQFGGLGEVNFLAQSPLIIGDYLDPYQYDGEGVRPLEGTARGRLYPALDAGDLVVRLTTTETSGPVVIAQGVELIGEITIVFDEFSGPEPFMSGGIAETLDMHGDTGLMSAAMPELLVGTAGWGFADVYLNGELLYENLAAHFMLGDRVRRGADFGYSLLRESDDMIYSPGLENKTGFVFSDQKELHLFLSRSADGIESLVPQDFALHVVLLVTAPAGEDGSSSTTTSEDPGGGGGGSNNGGPKGNNGIGNGIDDQPPGNPPVNDDGDTPGNKGGPRAR